MQNFKLNEEFLLNNQDWTFPTFTAYGPGRFKEIGKFCKNFKDFILMTMTGVLGGTAAILFIYSYRLISASKIASFEYLGIPSSFILGWIFFNEAPWSQLFPGVIVIIFAGMIIIWRDNIKKKSIEGNKQIY